MSSVSLNNEKYAVEQMPPFKVKYPRYFPRLFNDHFLIIVPLNLLNVMFNVATDFILGNSQREWKRSWFYCRHNVHLLSATTPSHHPIKLVWERKNILGFQDYDKDTKASEKVVESSFTQAFF